MLYSLKNDSKLLTNTTEILLTNYNKYNGKDDLVRTDGQTPCSLPCNQLLPTPLPEHSPGKKWFGENDEPQEGRSIFALFSLMFTPEEQNAIQEMVRICQSLNQVRINKTEGGAALLLNEWSFNKSQIKNVQLKIKNS